MLFDEEKSDYDDIATSGESKEIERAEKKAAKKAALKVQICFQNFYRCLSREVKNLTRP